MKKAALLIPVFIAGFAHAQLLHNWTRTIGSSTDDQGHCVTYQEDNTVISAGTFTGTVDFDPSPSGTFNQSASGANLDMYVMMYNSIGTFMWARQVGGSGIEVPESIIVDATGNVYVCGHFKGTTDFNYGATPSSILTSVGGDDIFLMKYNSSGVFQWVRRMGSAGEDQGWDLAFDGAGNLLFSGCFSNSTSFNTTSGKLTLTSVGGMDAFFSRVNSSGTMLWIKQIGSVNDDIAYGITRDNAGAAYVCGTFGGTADFDPGPAIQNRTPNGLKDLFVAQYSIAGGAYGWANSAGSPTSDDIAQDICYYGNAVYFTGYVGAGSTTIGVTYNNPGPGTDAYLASYSVGSLPNWFYGFPGSTGDEAGQDIDADLLGYIYTSGYFTNTINVNPSGSPVNLVSNGQKDFYILRYNAGGIFKTGDGFGSAGDEECPGIAAHYNLQFLYTTGYFSNTVDFNPDPGLTVNRTSLGGQDIFLSRYNWTAPIRLHSLSGSNETKLYPNPVSEILYIEHLSAGSVAEVYSTDGKKAGSWTADGTDRLAIDLGELANGVYLLRITETDGSFKTEKIIVQH